MIIWSGWGFLAILIPMATGFLFMAPIAAMSTGKHSWPLALGVLLGGIIVWILGTRWNGQDRVLVDPQTGQPVTLRRRHSLFFIPMQYWGVIAGIMALAILAS